MKFPNKTIPYNESVISRFSIILTHLSKGDTTISELYFAIKAQMMSIVDFVDALDCLFALGKIEYNDVSRRISCVI